MRERVERAPRRAANRRTLKNRWIASLGVQPCRDAYVAATWSTFFSTSVCG